MVERDIHSWQHLEEEIVTATGNRYSHQSLSKYAIGTTLTPPEVVQDFAKTLELDEDERWRLAWRYAYESRAEPRS